MTMIDNIIELRPAHAISFTDAEWKALRTRAEALAAGLRQRVTIEAGAGERGEQWAALLLGDPDGEFAPFPLLSVVKTARARTAALLDGMGRELATGRTVADLLA